MTLCRNEYFLKIKYNVCAQKKTKFVNLDHVLTSLLIWKQSSQTCLQKCIFFTVKISLSNAIAVIRLRLYPHAIPNRKLHVIWRNMPLSFPKLKHGERRTEIFCVYYGGDCRIIWSQNVHFVTTVPLTRTGVLFPRVRDFY